MIRRSSAAEKCMIRWSSAENPVKQYTTRKKNGLESLAAHQAGHYTDPFSLSTLLLWSALPPSLAPKPSSGPFLPQSASWQGASLETAVAAGHIYETDELTPPARDHAPSLHAPVCSHHFSFL